MPDVRLADLNLNLLIDLDVLLTERSVTRAAARRGVSQSAMSHALARLRQMLRDPLLTRGPSGAALTPRAERLARRLRVHLDELRRALADEDAFDPATAVRTARIATNDFYAAVIGGGLLRDLRRRAPGIDLDLVPIQRGRRAEPLEAGEVDLMLTLRVPEHPGLRCRKLLEGDLLCIVRKGHPCLQTRFDLDAYCSLEHVQVTPGGDRGGAVDDLLARRGRHRNVVMSLPWFAVAPLLVVHTDLVLTLPRLIALEFAPLGLVLLPPPFELPSFPLHMVWHERVDAEPAHRMLRDAVVSCASELAGPPSGG